MSLLKNTHCHSAAVNTASESEDERKNRAGNKKKIQFKGGGRKTNCQNVRERVVMSVRVLIIQNCRIIKFRDSCDVPSL